MWATLLMELVSLADSEGCGDGDATESVANSRDGGPSDCVADSKEGWPSDLEANSKEGGHPSQ